MLWLICGCSRYHSPRTSPCQKSDLGEVRRRARTSGVTYTGARNAESPSTLRLKALPHNRHSGDCKPHATEEIHHRMEETASQRRSPPNLATQGGFARKAG